MALLRNEIQVLTSQLILGVDLSKTIRLHKKSSQIFENKDCPLN